MKKYLLIVLAGLSLTYCGKKEKVVSLSPVQFQQQIKDTPDAMLLDVRTFDEVQAGRIPGEVNMDFNSPEFPVLIKGLDKTKTYFVYCASGVRSGKAADQMREEGFEKVYTLEGGIKAWEAAQLPVQH